MQYRTRHRPGQDNDDTGANAQRCPLHIMASYAYEKRESYDRGLWTLAGIKGGLAVSHHHIRYWTTRKTWSNNYYSNLIIRPTRRASCTAILFVTTDITDVGGREKAPPRDARAV